MGANVKVARHAAVFWGWKGRLEIDGNVLRIVAHDGTNRLDIYCSAVKRFSFNSNNGLFAIRMRDGTKLYLQMSGQILSADRSIDGTEATHAVRELLGKFGGRGFSI